MKYKQRSFSLPSTTPTKTPCAIHHIVKGKCLRCDVKVRYELTEKGRAAAIKGDYTPVRETVPTDSEGAE